MRADFVAERYYYSDCLAGAPTGSAKAFHNAVQERFGATCHVAGGRNGDGRGCFVIMRSEREDDTSKPLLGAMRKAADQLTGKAPSFIAVQFQDVESTDLLLSELRRRMGILSYALFGRYGGEHVNATYFSGYGAGVLRDGMFGTPAFGVPNPRPKFGLGRDAVLPHLLHLSDAEFAAVIGAPLSGQNISDIELGGVGG